MSALTSGTAAVIPSSAERLIRTAEENDWQASAVFGAAGSKGRTADAWVVGLEAYTTAGEVSLLLYWERGRSGFRYVAKESRGVQDGVRLEDMQLKAVTTLVTEAEVTDPFEYGECGCEDPEEVDNPRVCIEHAYCPARFDARCGWGSEVTRNYELAGWGEDGGTGGQYSLRVEPVEGQVELTLADVIPAAVRTAVIPGMPEPVDVGDCCVPVADGFNGFCDAYGVRLYLVGTRRDGRLMCAEHAAQRAGVPVSALPVLEMDAEERQYAADCIEDNRQHRVLRGAEEWAEAREREGRTISHAFEGWAEKNWTGDDFAAAYVAWLHTTGHAADPVHAWAITGPVDRVQQAEVRLEAARGQLATAQALHVSSQRYGGETAMREALERLHTAHAMVAASAADHAAEEAVRAEESVLDAPAAVATTSGASDRCSFGLPTGELGGRIVHVNGHMAGRVRESGRHWYAITPGRDARPAEHADRDSAAAHLVRCADQRAAETRNRVRAERAAAAAHRPTAVPAARYAVGIAPVTVPDRHHGRTVAEWKDVADGHALRAVRAGRAIQAVRVAVEGPAVPWTDTPDTSVPGWAAPVLPRIRDLARTALRRGAVAQELWMRIGWEAWEAAEAGGALPARRAAELAHRTAFLADACEHAAAEAAALATPVQRPAASEQRSYRSAFASCSVASDASPGAGVSPPRGRSRPPRSTAHSRGASKPRSYISQRVGWGRGLIRPRRPIPDPRCKVAAADLHSPVAARSGCSLGRTSRLQDARARPAATRRDQQQPPGCGPGAPWWRPRRTWPRDGPRRTPRTP
ncbi:hypothetical protein OG753_40465 [Streptomyces sp. NBC_00029]|uniref:hypothetical protein n=1 Tax=Streptomyces sp. NBC_00029 TaxID=2903613 RepID=UPI00324A1641